MLWVLIVIMNDEATLFFLSNDKEGRKPACVTCSEEHFDWRFKDSADEKLMKACDTLEDLKSFAILKACMSCSMHDLCQDLMGDRLGTAGGEPALSVKKVSLLI